MTEKKYCERCGKLIGDAYETDFFAYIRMKYCSDCKVKVRREKNAEKKNNKHGGTTRQTFLIKRK